MSKYRKRPIVVDAWELKQDFMPDWLSVAFAKGEVRNRVVGDDWWRSGLVIRTLEGEMVATPGDWIIKGVADELYPCRADIFATTYEPAPDAEAA